MTAHQRDAPVDESHTEHSTAAGERSASDPGWGRRIAAGVAGGTLIGYGVSRRSLGGAALAIAGVALLYWGVTAGGSRSGLASEGDASGEESHAGDGSMGEESHAGDGSMGEASDARDGSMDENTDTRGGSPGPTGTSRAITVERPPEELYDRWREPQTMSHVFGEFASVSSRPGDRQHWTLAVPFGRRLSWDTEVVEDRPGERLRWETVGSPPFSVDGSVRFRELPGDDRTEVALRLDADPPGGALGDAVVARLDVLPESVGKTVLRRFEELVESEERASPAQS